MSALNLHESRLASHRSLGDAGAIELERLIVLYEVAITAFDSAQARLAFEPHLTFGKGRHPARLNLADCAAYALAKSKGLPLLFKGDDFARTDIESAH